MLCANRALSPRSVTPLHIVGAGCDEARASSIYPVASSDLPGSSPTRYRQPPCWPGCSGFGPRSHTTIAASRNAWLAATVAAGSPETLAVSTPNAAHHSPDIGSGLAPATPDQGCCWGCQLAATRCSRAAAIIASAAASSSRSRATSWSEGGPSSPDPRRASARLPYRTAALANCAPGRGCALSAAHECWQCSLTCSALRIPFQSDDVFANPSD